MACHAQGGGVSEKPTYLWGAFSRLGLAVAVTTAVLDQALKLWLLFGYQLGAKGTVAVAPFVSLVLTWNTGISYWWFQQDGPFGQWALLALKSVAVALLWIWLSRAGTRLTALSLGLIIGGALGNGIDRLAYGAVADFVLLHIETATWRFHWYVFNLADVAIVAGVAGLLFESLVWTTPQKRPDPGDILRGKRPGGTFNLGVATPISGLRHDEARFKSPLHPCRRSRVAGVCHYDRRRHRWARRG